MRGEIAEADSCSSLREDSRKTADLSTLHRGVAGNPGPVAE
jgi:hypothetical protein